MTLKMILDVLQSNLSMLVIELRMADIPVAVLQAPDR